MSLSNEVVNPKRVGMKTKPANNPDHQNELTSHYKKVNDIFSSSMKIKRKNKAIVEE